MKLASLKGGRDGRLVVVSRDLTRALSAESVAPTLQAVLDDWAHAEPLLRALAAALEQEAVDGIFDFDPAAAAAPLPRAYQWADGSAYVNHVELVRQARGAEMPESFWHDPLMYQGGSDEFLGAHDPIRVLDAGWGLDFEGEIAVIVDDVPMGASREEALERIRLVLLVNDVSLRGLIPGELAKGFGFFQAKPATAASPVALTPDALGDAWREGRLHRPLRITYNGELFGCPDAGVDMTFDFGTLIAHAARTRNLGAGSIVGSGTVSNKQGTVTVGGDHGSAIGDGGVGYSCIAEIRMIETIRDGAPTTAFMDHGDTVRMEMFDAGGASLFGAINQHVAVGPR